MTVDYLPIYAAGLFDGEGSVAIRRKPPQKKITTSPLPRYRLECYIHMTNPVPLQLLQERWGGSIVYRKAQRSHWKDSYQWCVQSLKARTFLTDLLPYLIVKNGQSELGIAFQDHLVEFGAFRYQGQGLKRLPLDDMIRIRESFFNRMKELNMRGVKVQD